MKKRSEVDLTHTWDLSSLFADERAYETELEAIQLKVSEFVANYEGNLNLAQNIVNCLSEYQNIQESIVHLNTYVSLNMSADQSDEVNLVRAGKLQIVMSDLRNKLSFMSSELSRQEDALLNEAIALNSNNSGYLKDVLRDKVQMLDEPLEKLLVSLSAVLDASYGTYNRAKLADMDFPSITVGEETYPMSFVVYENELEFNENHEVRHAAFKAFHETLKSYENVIASIYQTHVTQEKVLADVRGFDSVIDSLLFEQKVSRDMYDRQIDLVMEYLAPHMRRYAELLKEVHGLDKMTFADLKLTVDPDFEPEISIEESKAYLLDGLSILGEDYAAMIHRAFDERWIDFPQNVGKSTGAFCSSPYGAHPYILINWTKKMREVFVLAHEVGHAGHFYMSGMNQSIFDTRASLYFIEAPSTMNELLMAEHLKKNDDDPRFRRWVLSTMISRTYYHNFVTHLLEAAFQREVYRKLDAKETLSTRVINDLKRKVLETFWGDSVEITEGAELTWMRQPHYYMGLYPYTYSAGLTLATEVSKKVISNELDIERWKDVLKAGGTKTPLELAAMVGVDLSTEAPLLNTIETIGQMINEIIEITKALD